MEAKGHSGVVSFDGRTVHIERGAVMSSLGGVKSIDVPLESIVAVNCTEPSLFTNGIFSISVDLGGGKESGIIANSADVTAHPLAVYYTKNKLILSKSCSNLLLKLSLLCLNQSVTPAIMCPISCCALLRVRTRKSAFSFGRMKSFTRKASLLVNRIQ